MNKIKEFLETEKEKEKIFLLEEFEKKKKDLEEKWRQELELMEKNFSLELEQRKKEFLQREKQKQETNLLHKISQKKEELVGKFFSEALNFLSKLPKENKEKIFDAALISLKQKFVNEMTGEFLVEKNFGELIKKYFPEAKIKESDDLDFGFIYKDKELEINFTKKTIIQRFIENFKII